MGLKRKDLLSLTQLSADDISLILETADSFKEASGREIKKVPALRGKTVVNLFFEPSTRTRTSFELAAKRLSADVINFSPSSSSVVKGETLLDTARNIEAMQADIIVLRHSSAGAAETLARGVKSSVINAGDGWHEHPTQALLDLYTIRSRGMGFNGLRVAIVGDVAQQDFLAALSRAQPLLVDQSLLAQDCPLTAQRLLEELLLFALIHLLDLILLNNHMLVMDC